MTPVWLPLPWLPPLPPLVGTGVVLVVVSVLVLVGAVVVVVGSLCGAG
jgi:hypothetical protein